MGIIVHHLENSRSQRVLWLLEELQLPYEVVRYGRESTTGRAPKAVADIHPLGKLSLLQDGSLTLAESGLIFEHLLGKSPVDIGQPIDPIIRQRYQLFMHYAEGSLMPPLFALLVLNRMGDAARAAISELKQSFAEHLTWMNAELETRVWFAADSFTAADVMMSFPLEAARQRGGLDSRYEKLNLFLERVHAGRRIAPRWPRADLTRLPDTSSRSENSTPVPVSTSLCVSRSGRRASSRTIIFQASQAVHSS